MNEADSEKIQMMLLQSGFMKVASWEKADLVIFNTCSVRKKGEDRVFSMMNDLKKDFKKSGKKIVTGITGCMVRKTGMNKIYLPEDTERDAVSKIEYLEHQEGIFNNDDKLFPKVLNLDFTLRIEEIKYLPFILTHIYGEKIGQEDKFADYLKQKQQRENPYSASVIIQTGCDNYCTFCIVPFTRGKEISRPIEEIVSECREAVKNGAREITLLGQNVNSYGKQFIDRKYWNEEKGKWNEWLGKSPFRQLLEELNTIDGLDRIRFTSSNPHDMTQDILDAHFELPKLCNYLHFALQSGSNEMLKRMNRKHTYEDFKKIVEYLRRKDPLFSISTDMIVGFSGETDEMFHETLRAFDSLQFDFAYNARYSVRPQTLAAKMYPDDVPNSVKADRWHQLNSTLEHIVEKRNTMMIGCVEEVMINGERDDQWFGRTRNFKEVFFDKPKVPEPVEAEKEIASLNKGGTWKAEGLKVWDIVKIKITELDRWVLKGERV